MSFSQNKMNPDGLHFMLENAVPFVLQNIDSKQADDFKKCQGTYSDVI